MVTVHRPVPTIAGVRGRQIFDSRGRPTVEADVRLSDGTLGRAAVPSGASTGSFEAHERRDRTAEHAGLGVRGAVAAIHTELAAVLQGRTPTEQAGIDALLVEADGTASLDRLGANAVLACSLAVCRAAAAAAGQPLYRWIAELAGVGEPRLPVPMVNILSGGLHAGASMDIQDLLVVPLSAGDLDQAYRDIAAVRAAAQVEVGRLGRATLLADEGGLAPGCRSTEEALGLLVRSITAAGLTPGIDIGIALDVAAHSLARDGKINFSVEGVARTADEMVELVARWAADFPVVSVEDALDEDDWAGWAELTRRLGDRVDLVGDDLFVTQSARLRHGIEHGCGNAVLVKVNQNGTLTGTLELVALARRHGYAVVVSARSGETEDAFLADLAAGVAGDRIKVGSFRTSERLAKYNQLLRIAEDGIGYQRPGPHGRPGRGDA